MLHAGKALRRNNAAGVAGIVVERVGIEPIRMLERRGAVLAALIGPASVSPAYEVAYRGRKGSAHRMEGRVLIP